MRRLALLAVLVACGVQAGTRPYELDWANRTADDRPVLMRLERADGWTVRTKDAAATLTTQLVEDVHAFPGHIACDADSRSELVVPLVREGAVLGVLDLDSPVPARFDDEDAGGCEALAVLLAARI